MPVRTGEDPEQTSTPDTRLADALKPTVEAALKRSVRDEPRSWIEAFFPILLPSIRLAVTSALREMVQTLNQVLEQGLSLRSWRWRLEAWRTGRPFAEVVLLRTLVYRVEQVLLLDRNTGLLLTSVAAVDVSPKDTHQISGMLTAIQEFIHDSFEVEKDVGIRELHAGDFSFWVEQGPQVALAAAVRGNAPAELRETLRAAIDLVHQEFGAELRAFRGETKPFEQHGRAILEGCLQSRYHAEETSYWKLALCGVAVAATLFVWAGFQFQEARQWSRALRALGDVPGIMITHANHQGGGYVLEGLRDPLAGSPESVLASNGIDLRNVRMRLRPFLSLEPKLVVKRARAAIEAPDSVVLTLEQNVLKLDGTASHAWIVETINAGQELTLLGIGGVRIDGLRDSDLELLQREIEAHSFLFPLASSTLTPAQAVSSKTLAEKTEQWISGAIAIGKVPRVEVIGCTDNSGTEEGNRGLSQQRAERVAELLIAGGVRRDMLMIKGNGTCSTPADNSVDATLRRNVTFRLSFDSARLASAEVR